MAQERRRVSGGGVAASAERRLRPALLPAALLVAVVASLAARLAQALVLAPGRYKTLTRIRLRESPSVDAEPTGDRLEKGEVFEVEEIVEAGASSNVGYLRVAGRNGWVFDQGIAGAWVGKDILERVLEAAPAEADVVVPTTPTAPTAPTMPTAPTVPTASTAEAAPAPAPAPVPMEPVVAIGMAQIETLRLPGNMLGAGFELLRLEVKGAPQPLAFLLGTAFPINALTPRGRELLPGTDTSFKGGWLSQAAAAANRMDLEGVRLWGSGAAIDDIKDVEVLEFPQAQLLGQLGVEVHGVLGKPFFEQYDMDLDRYGQRAQFYSPGQAAAQGFYSTVRHLPGIALPSGNLGIVLTGHAVDDDLDDRKASFVGLVDSSAAHTVINWEAAKLLGYSGPTDPKLMAATKVLGAGKTGQAEEMPVVMAKFTVSGKPEILKPMMLSVDQEEFKASGGKGWYFEEKTLAGGPGSLELGAINVAIGDVLGLSVMTDSMIGPFTGAAAIIGQDLLFQAQRVVINLGEKSLWLEPGDIRDAPEM